MCVCVCVCVCEAPVDQTCQSKCPCRSCIFVYSVKVRTILTTRSAFLFSPKDVLPILQQSMIVYKFHQCLCVADYIGRTIQRLEVRAGQHVLRGICRWSEPLISGLSQSHESAIHKLLCHNYLCPTSYLSVYFSLLYKAIL